jgi:hypothetical protein
MSKRPIDIDLPAPELERGGAVAFDPTDRLKAMFPGADLDNSRIGHDPFDPEHAFSRFAANARRGPERLALLAKLGGQPLYCVEEDENYLICSEYGPLAHFPVNGDGVKFDPVKGRLRMLRIFDRILTPQEYEYVRKKPRRDEP